MSGNTTGKIPAKANEKGRSILLELRCSGAEFAILELDGVRDSPDKAFISFRAGSILEALGLIKGNKRGVTFGTSSSVDAFSITSVTDDGKAALAELAAEKEGVSRVVSDFLGRLSRFDVEAESARENFMLKEGHNLIYAMKKEFNDEQVQAAIVALDDAVKVVAKQLVSEEIGKVIVRFGLSSGHTLSSDGHTYRIYGESEAGRAVIATWEQEIRDALALLTSRVKKDVDIVMPIIENASQKTEGVSTTPEVASVLCQLGLAISIVHPQQNNVIKASTKGKAVLELYKIRQRSAELARKEEQQSTPTAA